MGYWSRGTRERIEREMGERKWNGGWRGQVDGGRQDGCMGRFGYFGG